MKKPIFILLFTLLSASNLIGQQYYVSPGMDKFMGIWLYTNGQDSIWMQINSKYFGNDIFQMKILKVYYTYKQGNNILYNNYLNAYINGARSDFSGNAPYGGVSRDTLQIGGKDLLKRKDDEGYLAINAAQNQLTFKRAIGISGGGINIYRPGEGPLPGYTLPESFTMIKQEPTIIDRPKEP